MAVRWAKVEVQVSEDIGDVVDDGLVHFVHNLVPQHLPHHPLARRH